MGFGILGKLMLRLGEGAGAPAAVPGWMHVELPRSSRNIQSCGSGTQV